MTKAPEHLKKYEWYLQHQAWLSINGCSNHDPEGASPARANLEGSDFHYTYLQYANLQYAHLCGANLRGANLNDMNLQDANLSQADLQGANLRGTNLRGAILNETNLWGARLKCTDFRDTHLRCANFRSADLLGAIGLVRIPVGDPRGYDAFARYYPAWTIGSGCNYFHSISDAREHWGSDYDGEREIGDLYLHGLAWLESNAERLIAKWTESAYV